ncbi:hypothetical protein BJF89_17030 [Corynebacterium sp. CNJ-954]|uniref:AbfB domain-containing protein n=1 Tax=Corynebacterium sp. CNJ-954 TaxID=1904962 RepID=UPI0009590FEF|nr:AbfB domain-containing protein [Corynebacterium sp. CNJ-954]OLT54278.1 hypothetical protein BJF89_17030 [Corynebacterium sp. CNJ-954]
MNPTDASSCSPARSTTAARVTTAAKRGILAAITTVAATGLAMSTGGTALAAPSASLMSTKAGDGGLETKTCTASNPQVRIDSFDVPGTSACYELTAASGWVAVNITGSYGVINNLTSPVSVAFKLPDGAVYWQATIAPGEVHSIDVNRGGSTVVELQVAPVSSPNGPSTGNLDPGPDADGTDSADNVVSLRSAGNRVSGQVARINWNGVVTSPLTRNSGFTDRLDGSFKVVRALDGSGCISLESAAYPDTYLHTTTGNGVAASINPDPTAATWCATDAATPVTGKYLASAADQSRVLTTGTATNRALTTTTTRNAESAWFVDTALAFPAFPGN